MAESRGIPLISVATDDGPGDRADGPMSARQSGRSRLSGRSTPSSGRRLGRRSARSRRGSSSPSPSPSSSEAERGTEFSRRPHRHDDHSQLVGGPSGAAGGDSSGDRNTSCGRLKAQTRAARAFVYWAANSNVFSGLIMGVIVLNALAIALETNRTLRQEHERVFAAADLVFLTLYTIEFLLHMFAAPVRYLRNTYNRFDVLVLFLSYAQFVFIEVADFGDLTFLRVVRALRALRALRSVTFFRPLQVLVNAFYKTLSDVVNLIALLFLVIYVFGIMGVYLFDVSDAVTTADGGSGEGSGVSGAVSAEWGTLARAMLSLFTFVTADGWTVFQGHLDTLSRSTRWFTVAFIIIGHFVFTNMFIGVIIENIDNATEEEERRQREIREGAIAKKRAFILSQQEADYERLVEQTRRHPGVDVNTVLAEMAGRLHSADLVPMTHLVCNRQWISTYLTALRQQEHTQYRLQQLSFELSQTMSEIVERRLEGQVKISAAR